MNGQPQSAQRFDYDFAPAMKVYLDSVESWQASYEKLMKNSNLTARPHGSDAASSTYSAAMDNWRVAGQEVFKRIIEEQIELCRFFGKRWESYLDLPEQFARCRTPADAAQLQLEFFTRMATEYAKESTTLIQPVSELMAKWAPDQPAR